MKTMTQPHILVVDDNPMILDSYARILLRSEDPGNDRLKTLETALFGTQTPKPIKPKSFLLDCVRDGQLGCERVKELQAENCRVAVAFVDMRMPGQMDGLQTIAALWAIDPDIQMVICTAFTDRSWEEITASLGDTDQLLILRKPFERIEVLQLACALMEKWHLLRARENQLAQLEYSVTQRTEHLQRALREREQLELLLYHNATHDDLTGLPNRVLLQDRLKRALFEADRRETKLMICFIDLDHFKWVNDSLGHNIGDKFLTLLAEKIAATLRASDTLARLGGDEFVLILPDCGAPETLMPRLNQLMVDIATPIGIADTEIAISCSIGCSAYPEDSDDAATLLKFAEVAMYSVKSSGRNGIQLYNPALQAKIDDRIRITAELRQALKCDELVLHYQPQVELCSGRILGVEALMRWQHPTQGLLGPQKFIPIAEETGLIGPMTEWLLHAACRQGRRWQQAGLPPLHIAVNITAQQLEDAQFPAIVGQCLSDSGFDPACLELELTESAAMSNPKLSIILMQALKTLGVKLSIDDFGTGYSNMHYLKHFPVDKLKLDGSFIREMLNDKRSYAITGAIIAMAHALGLTVLGEMAETEGQVVSLAEQGCEQVQGYYFSRPLPANQCEPLLAKGYLPSPDALRRIRTKVGTQPLPPDKGELFEKYRST
jgi:diguanylate cyclase (GGDEF)-like protein